VRTGQLSTPEHVGEFGGTTRRVDSTTIRVHTEVESVATDWDELALRVGAIPWVRRGWIEAWLDAFGGSLEAYALVDDGRLFGLLPLVRRGHALVSPTNWHTPAFAPLAEGDLAATSLVRAAIGARPRRLDIRFLPEESVDVRALASCAELAGYQVLRRVLVRAPCISLRGSWDDYERGRARKLRNDLRRCERRLAERGRLSVDIDSGDDRLDGLLDEGFRVEGSGWKEQGGTGITSGRATERFYRSVARWARDEGWLRLAFLRLDGRVVAFDLMLEIDGALYDVKGGYDPEFARYSPGKLLLREVLSQAFARGLTRFEFLGAEETYKLSWATETRARWHLQAFAPSLPGRLEWAAFNYGRPLTKKLLSLLR
jgi:CelD/BcsL family acetyltransferase involved in cellulose biosynthesis